MLVNLPLVRHNLHTLTVKSTYWSLAGVHMYGTKVHKNTVTGQMLNLSLNSFCVRMMRASRRKQNVDSAREYEAVCVKAHCDTSTTSEGNQNSGLSLKYELLACLF